MPTAVGPNTKREENLVFGYDLGDVSNSYKGEPTTNLATLDLSSTKWYSEGGTKVLQSETLDGYPVYQFRSSGSLIYVSPVAFNQLTVTSNDVTLSAYFKNIGTSTQTVNVFLANDFGTDSNGDPNNRNIPADGKWYKQSWTRYAAANTYNQVEFRTFSDTLLISKPQVEYKKHATPPVEGTRSATQGLLDLTGNSTIDLSNVSFDSNAQMIFDGTDDYVYLTDKDITGNFTSEAWIKTDNVTTYRTIISWGVHTTNQDRSMWLESDTGKLCLYFYPTGTNMAKGVSNVADGNWHHCVATWDGSIGRVYVDGVLEGSLALTADSYTYGGTYIGKNVSNAYRFAGTIKLGKIYNRALTASEIKSNYNAVKGRFNI